MCRLQSTAVSCQSLAVLIVSNGVWRADQRKHLYYYLMGVCCWSRAQAQSSCKYVQIGVVEVVAPISTLMTPLDGLQQCIERPHAGIQHGGSCPTRFQVHNHDTANQWSNEHQHTREQFENYMSLGETQILDGHWITLFDNSRLLQHP